MSKKHIKYIVIVAVISFVVWLVGEIILMVAFPLSSMTTARVWVVAVFAAACIWCIVHLAREDKKQIEDEENDNYKGVY